MDTGAEELRKNLSANLKKQRKSLGFSQEHLAEIADLSLNMVNDIEGCRTWVSDKTIVKLARALNTEAYRLLTPAFEDGPGPPSPSADEILAAGRDLLKKILAYRAGGAP